VAQGENGHLYGLNDDSTMVFEWTAQGGEVRRTPNATGARYQDMDVVRGSLVCTGADPNGGVIDILDPASLTLLVRHRCHARTPNGHLITSKGFAFAEGTFYFLPADGEFPMLMSYTLDDVTLADYVPSAGS